MALRQVLSIVRGMAAAERESERLSLLLEAEDVLADRYVRQGEQAEATEAPAASPEPEVELTEEPEPALAPEPAVETIEQEQVAAPVAENITEGVAEPQVSQSEAIAAAVPSVDAPAPEPGKVDYLYVDPEPIHAPSHLAAEGVR